MADCWGTRGILGRWQNGFRNDIVVSFIHTRGSEEDGGLLGDALADQQDLVDEEHDVVERERVRRRAEAAPLEPVLNPRDLAWEDHRGEVHWPGRTRPIGKISSWSDSVSARCMIHGNCRRAHSFRQIPYGSCLVDWLCDGMDPKCGSAAEHMALPKPIRK